MLPSVDNKGDPHYILVSNAPFTMAALNLCEDLWASILSFIAITATTCTTDTANRKQQLDSKREDDIDRYETAERSLRCTCKALRQILTSEPYYRAKVIDTYQKLNDGDEKGKQRSSANNRSAWPSAACVGGWRALNGILSHYAPLEGWYTVCDAWPWGLLVLCQFQEGKFCGDVVRAVTEANGDVTNSADSKQLRYHDYSERVFEISFEKGGEAKCEIVGTSAFRFGVLSAPASLRATGQHHVAFPRNGGILFQISDIAEFRPPPRYDLWTQRFVENFSDIETPSAVDLIKCLMNRQEGCERILLEYLDGPEGQPLSLNPISRSLTIHISSTMPFVNPGLYVGSYGADYGNFQHEIVQIRYLKVGGNDSDNSSVLEDAFGGRVPDEMSNLRSTILVSARKVTGDLHVPTGEVTWCANISADCQSSREPPHTIRDRRNIQHRVVRSWPGWGTLAFPYFACPHWDNGWLVQLEDDDRDDTSRFAFCWSSFEFDECTVLTALPNPGGSYLWSAASVKVAATDEA